jgi:hypothetical protein
MVPNRGQSSYRLLWTWAGLIALAIIMSSVHAGRAQQRPDLRQALSASNASSATSESLDGRGLSSRYPLYVDVDCKSGCRDDEQKSWWNRLWADPTATFTGTLSLLTLALVITGAIQGVLIVRAERLTRAALRISARQARASSKAAEAAIGVYRRGRRTPLAG